MAVPNYQIMMKPLLKFLEDGEEKNIHDVYEHVAKHFKLSDEDRRDTVPSGPEPRYINRTSWARTYMGKAGLLSSPRRGFIQITPRGLDLLKENPETINNNLLKRYDEFRDFKKPKDRTEKVDEEENSEDESSTPEDLIDKGMKTINKKLSDDLLEELYKTDPFYFEQIVADLMTAMGYGQTEVTKRSNDGGVDAIVNEDALGIDRIFVQAKRYTSGNVNGKELRDFVGSLEMNGVSKGIFITTSDFSKDALSNIERVPKSIILINGDRLTALMIRYGVGVSTESVVELKKLDKDYFEQI